MVTSISSIPHALSISFTHGTCESTFSLSSPKIISEAAKLRRVTNVALASSRISPRLALAGGQAGTAKRHGLGPFHSF